MKECGRDKEVEAYMHGCLNAEPHLVLCFSFLAGVSQRVLSDDVHGSSDPDA